MGLPFSPLGVTILIPGVWNGEICVFCGQPDFRLDFGAKSDEFLRYFGWLKPWFGVGGVVKITVSVEHGCSRFWTPFQWSFSFENGTEVDMWLTLGVPGAPMGGIWSRSRFRRFLMIFRGPPGLSGEGPRRVNPTLWGPTNNQSYRHQTSNLSTVNY